MIIITQNSQAKSLLDPPGRRGGLQQGQPCCGKTEGTASASLDPGWHRGRLSAPTPVLGAHVRTSRRWECTTKPEMHTCRIKVWSRHRNPISHAMLTWSVYWELMMSPTLILTLSCWKHSRSGVHDAKLIKPPVAAPFENFLPAQEVIFVHIFVKKLYFHLLLFWLRFQYHLMTVQRFKSFIKEIGCK